AAEQPPLRRDGGTASRNARCRWPPRGRALGLESAALRWPLGEWRQNGAVGTASARIWRGASHSRLANNRRAQARASLRGCAVAGSYENASVRISMITRAGALGSERGSATA